MSIFKFITLSQLRKVLSALETRFKKIEYDVENPPTPDWNQNDPNAADYIKNRPFYTEPTTTLISTTINNGQSFSNGDISSIESMSLVEDELPYTAIWNGTIYTGVFRYDSTHFAYLFGNTYDDNGEDTGEPFSGNISIDTFHVETYPRNTQVTEDINFSLSIHTENVHKIDNKYLNGRLIKNGSGDSSAILNDSTNGSADGDFAVSEGSGNASGDTSHAEGFRTTASGSFSHAEGNSTTASGNDSHAEGYVTTVSGHSSHAEGYVTTASGHSSHAEGRGTTANHKSQHVFGEYNVADTNVANADARGDYVEIVGKGTGNNARSNARTLDWSGNEWLAGKLTVGAGPTSNMDVATKQYVDTSLSGFSSSLSGLTDTTISSPANGQALVYDSSASKWKNQTINIASTVNQLTDTTISSPANGQALVYDSSASKWKNQTINITSTVEQLTDTTISSPSNGQVLMYNSTTSKWENTSLPVYNGGIAR